MEYRYRTTGSCSEEIIIELDGRMIRRVEFIGGCTGNAQGIAKLVTGRTIEEVAGLLKGIPCQGDTSCPDQLARALIQLGEKAC